MIAALAGGLDDVGVAVGGIDDMDRVGAGEQGAKRPTKELGEQGIHVFGAHEPSRDRITLTMPDQRAGFAPIGNSQPLLQPKLRGFIQRLEEQAHLAPATLIQVGAERKRLEDWRAAGASRQHALSECDRLEFEMAAADAAGSVRLPHQHLGAGLPRRRALHLGDRHEHAALAARKKVQRLREPEHARYFAAKGRADGASARIRRWISSMAISTRSGVAGASRSGSRR